MLLESTMTSEDFIGILSEEQKKRMADALERELLVRPPTSRRFTQEADKILRAWARHVSQTDGKEIKLETGNVSGSTLGRFVRSASGQSAVKQNTNTVLDLTDEQFDYIQSVMITVSTYSRMFLLAHYIKKPSFLGELYSKKRQKKSETDKDYRRRIEKIYFKKVGLPKSTYNRHLKEARYEFTVRGGLL